MNNMSTSKVKEILKELFSEIEGIEPELFKNFTTYWSLRKSISLNSTDSIRRIKDLEPTKWIDIIQSNHKFREAFGEEAAIKLIVEIENILA